jgi:hypothetical protein
MLRIISIILFGALLIACSPPKTQPSSSQPFSSDQLDGQVRYEHIDTEGEFTGQKFINDPLVKNYDTGFWINRLKRKVTTLGEPSHDNRVHVVLVGDGYTLAQLPQYASDVEASLSQIEAQEPFRTYRNYFSFHRVDVISEESGISEDKPGTAKKTALEMTYNCGGIRRLLCANLNKVMLEAQSAPKVDSVLALANSSTYGGAGYYSPAVSTFAARSPNSLELALHEFGHSFANLADEYDYGDPESPDCNKANVSEIDQKQMKNLKLKWYRWLSTPGVGAFSGACYNSKMYRPTENSKMRKLGRPYDAVNTEQFILSIYSKVKPIEEATAPGVLTKHQVLTIKPMRPKGHKLKIEWRVNGERIYTLAGVTSLNTRDLDLEPGKNTISVKVWDPTSMVRDEKARDALMTSRLEWVLTQFR